MARERFEIPARISAEIDERGRRLKEEARAMIEKSLVKLQKDLEGRIEADIGRVGDAASGLDLPGRMGRILAWSDCATAYVVVVHDYEDAGEAIDGSAGLLEALSEAVPDLHLEVSYVGPDADLPVGFVEVAARRG